MPYTPSPTRYDNPAFYQRCGRSGLKLPRISLGLWHNFGHNVLYETSRSMVLHSFDAGITHFDLANNYGPPPGSAEEAFGKMLRDDLSAHRDELVVSTKAGYWMWNGPYGEWGSRKYLLASLDQSLKRLGLDYVDIFYHHRPDPDTPLEESMGALAHAVRSGKALYVGLSNYSAEQTARAVKILRDLGTPCLIHQPKYSMFVRTPEEGLLDVLLREGVGCIPFSPLAQGLLTNRYLNGIPADARAGTATGFLRPEHITDDVLKRIHALNTLAQARGQSLSQMALAWVARQPAVTTVLIGASRVAQIDDNLGALRNSRFDDAELAQIDRILAS
ncbi:aldo/keto reductase [Nibricoccus sp. IMCC34717]|uniref:aldo/keto reductase n=1 Tax=Nibricoccus sp. IMCC34717 TaxID=3034021 RepID=UPI00384F60EF